MSTPDKPMTETPLTDEEVEIAKKYPATEHGLWISANFARELERELADAKDDVKRLHGDKMAFLDRLLTVRLRCGYIINHCRDHAQAKGEAEEMLRVIEGATKSSLSAVDASRDAAPPKTNWRERDYAITRAAVVDRAEAVNLARMLTEREDFGKCTTAGVRRLCAAILRIDQALLDVPSLADGADASSERASYSDGYRDAAKAAAKLLRSNADGCSPGSEAEKQNWPFVLETMAREVEKLPPPSHTSASNDLNALGATLLAEKRAAEPGQPEPRGTNKALKLLQQAADGLYNGFEPDNQSALWLRINAFLKSEALPDRTSDG